MIYSFTIRLCLPRYRKAAVLMSIDVLRINRRINGDAFIFYEARTPCQDENSCVPINSSQSYPWGRWTTVHAIFRH